MTDSDRIDDLLERWEVAFGQGTELSAEELCRDCPHLTERVLEGIRALRATAWLKTRLTRTAPGYPRRADLGIAPGGRPGGKMLADRYRLVERIGEGGSGIVWRALDTTLGREVAVKLPKWKPPADGNDDPCLAEAWRVAQLDHPGIVPVYDVGRAGDSYYIVSKLLVRSLADVAAGQPLPPESAVEIVRRLSRIVSFAHHHGFIHRDLKPGNVLFDADWELYLADFGVATTARLSDPRNEGHPGTLAYMAPEQLRSWANYIGPFTDVWALGVILYELLTGQLPFAGQSVDEIRRNILERTPEHPVALRPELPADLANCCLRCLTKEVPAGLFAYLNGRSRYRTSAALEDALSHLALSRESAERRNWPTDVIGRLLGKLGRWAAKRWPEQPKKGWPTRRWTLDVIAGRSPLVESLLVKPPDVTFELGPGTDQLKTALAMALEVRISSEVDMVGVQTHLDERVKTPVRSGADRYLSRGLLYVLAGDSERAIADFGEAIRLAPLDAAGYYHRGQAFLLNWEDLAARKDFRHASRLDPTLTRAELLSAVAELRSPPGERLSGAKKEGAHGKGLGLPRDPYGQFCRGQSYFMSGDYEKAEAELSGAIARGVKTPNAYLYRAQANCYMGNFDQAFDVLTNAGTADPERVTSLRAWVHVRRGCARWANPAEALSDFDEALRLFPTYSDAYYYRGRTRLNQGDASGAMADLSSAIAGNTKEPDCYFQRGILFLTDGNCAPAVLDFEQAIRLNPSHGPLIYNYIRSRLEPGATASDLRDVFTRFGPDADHFSSIDLPMLLSRGLVRAAENDVGRAVEDFNRSLELDPKSAIALTARAEVLLSTGEYGQTIDDCQRALQIGSLPAETERKARQTLAKAYTHSKDYDRAIAEYDKAIARCPDPSGNLTSNRALALQAKGDYANAIEAWTAILGRLPWTGFLALHQRGIAWLQLGNNDQALQDFNQYIDRFSGDNALQNAGVLLLAQAYAHRGRLWRKKGDYGRATCDLDEALRLGTVNGHSELLMELALAERAWVWAACPDAAFRDGSRAVEAATRICEATAWACVDDIEALAAGYAEMGKFDEAVRRQRQALGCPTFQHYKPDDAEAALERLRLYESGHAFRGVCSRLS